MSRFVSLFLVLFLFGCGAVTPKLTFDAASVWADSQILTNAYERTLPIYETQKDKFTSEEQVAIEDFMFMAEYLINEFDDMSMDHTTLIAISEIDMIWSSTKEAFLRVRPIFVEKIEAGGITTRNKMLLESFDFKATELDASMMELLSEENSSATDVMKDIALVLGLTLKIVTVAAAL